MKIRNRIFFIMLGFLLFVMVAFSLYLFEMQHRSYESGIDRQLMLAAIMVRDILPPAYHDRITDKNSVSDVEYKDIVDKFNTICARTGLEYLWSLMLLNGRIVFTSATSPAKDVRNNDHAEFLETHTNPELYTKAFETMQPQYQTSNDTWGHIRAVVVPFYDSKGRKYLTGASVSMQQIDEHIRLNLLTSLGAGGVVLLLGLVFTYFLARSISHPIELITLAARRIAAGDRSVVVNVRGGGEPAVLAKHINSMSRSIEKRIEELTESQERLHVTLHSIGDAVITADIQGNITLMNEIAEQLTGWKAEEALGRPLPEVFHIINEQTREQCENPVEKVLRTGGIITLANHTALIRRDGTEFSIADSGAPIRDRKGGIIGAVLVFRDVTERRRAEEALRKSEEKFSKAFYTSPDSININRLKDGVYVEINEGFTRITGYTPEEVAGRSSLPGDLNIWVNAEDRERLVAGLRERGEVMNLEALFRCKDGRVINGSMSARIIEINNEPCILSITRDITEQKRAEEQLRKSALEKELLLTELQHRVKNNLNVIYSLLALESEKSQDAGTKQVFLNAQNRIRSMLVLYDRLYHADDFTGIDLHTYIEEFATQLFETYAIDPARIRLKTSLDEMKLDLKRAVPLGLILNELITNSLKYAYPPGTKGEIHICLERAEDQIVLCVSDDGAGLPAGLDSGSGKTLGLNLVAMLTKQISGELSVDSEKGTSITVRFRV